MALQNPVVLYIATSYRNHLLSQCN